MARIGRARWKGGLKDGKGRVETETGAVDAKYSFKSRFEDGKGTNPEELIGAAHAACFSMALAAALEKAGFAPERISTITLDTRGEVPGIDEAAFREQAEGAKANCPVSTALGGVDIQLNAALV